MNASDTLKEKRQRAGAAGGRATVERYGRAHMAEIGRRGARALYRRYYLAPAGVSGWALIDRESGEVKAIW